MKNVCYCGREGRETWVLSLLREGPMSAGGISWQDIAGPASGTGKAGGSHRGCRGVSVPVARARASPLQPERGGKDSRGTKLTRSGAMQLNSHTPSGSSVPWAASRWLCFSHSWVVWILFGGWFCETGVRTWISSIRQIVHIGRQTALEGPSSAAKGEEEW